jgi:hypothetical protein
MTRCSRVSIVRGFPGRWRARVLAVHAWTETVHAPNHTVHAWTETVHAPNHTVHAWTETVHTWTETVHAPNHTVHARTETVHAPNHTVHTWTETVHAPNHTVHTWTETVHARTHTVQIIVHAALGYPHARRKCVKLLTLGRGVVLAWLAGVFDALGVPVYAFRGSTPSPAVSPAGPPPRSSPCCTPSASATRPSSALRASRLAAMRASISRLASTSSAS